MHALRARTLGNQRTVGDYFPTWQDLDCHVDVCERMRYAQADAIEVRLDGSGCFQVHQRFIAITLQATRKLQQPLQLLQHEWHSLAESQLRYCVTAQPAHAQFPPLQILRCMGPQHQRLLSLLPEA